MKQFTFRLAAPMVCLALLLVAFGCGKKDPAPAAKSAEAAGAPEKVLGPLAGVSADSAVMPGADLVVVADLAAMRESAMFQILEKLGDENDALNSAGPDLTEVSDMAKKMSAMTGLEEEDFLRFKLAAELDDVDVASGNPPDMAKVNIVAAIEVAKEVTLDTIEKALRDAAEEEGDAKLVERTSYNGIDMLVGKEVDDSGNEEAFYFTMGGGNKVMLVGSEVGMKALIDRSSAGGNVDLADQIDPAIAAVIPQTQIALIFAATPQMREMIVQQSQAKQVASPNTMEANFAKAMEGFKGASIGIHMTDNMVFELNSVLGSDADAEQVKALMDGTVLGFVQIGLTMMTGGKPMPMLQTLKTEAKPNGVMSLGFTVSEQDVTVIQEAIAQQAAASAMPGMMPVPEDDEE